MANGDSSGIGSDLLKTVLQEAISGSSGGPLDRLGRNATSNQALASLALSLGLGAATSGGNPFRESPAQSTRTEIPSELADEVTRFKVQLFLAALQQGLSPQTFQEFLKRGPRPSGGLPRIPGIEQALKQVASQKGTTTSRTKVKSKEKGTSGFDQALATVLPLIVLLSQTEAGGSFLSSLGLGSGGSASAATPSVSPNIIFDQGGFGQTEIPEGGFDLNTGSSGGGNFFSNLLSFFTG